MNGSRKWWALLAAVCVLGACSDHADPTDADGNAGAGGAATGGRAGSSATGGSSAGSSAGSGIGGSSGRAAVGGSGGTALEAGSAGTAGRDEDAGAGGSGDGGAPPTCAQLTESGERDFDVRALTLTGNITLNGAALPDESFGRGNLIFRGRDGTGTIGAWLGQTGAQTYALRIPPGTYDVEFQPNPQICDFSTTSPLPCTGGRVREGFELKADTTWNVDLRALEITGGVTLAGGVLPNQSQGRGAIGFREIHGGSPFSVSLGTTGAGSYRARVLAAKYDLMYFGAGCPDAKVAPALPCNSGALRSAVTLQADTVANLDIPVAKLSGTVKLNGGDFPQDENGLRIGFVRAGAPPDETYAEQYVSAASGTNYAVTLLPGTYDVWVQNEEVRCWLGTPALPCIGGRIAAAVTAIGTKALDLDVRAVSITGATTLRGEPWSTARGDRGWLLFTNDSGNSIRFNDYASFSSTNYRVRAVQGTYSISYQHNPVRCAAPGFPSDVPCSSGVIKSDLHITGDTVVDIDLPVVAITGKVTVNGSEMPDAIFQRGALNFVRPGEPFPATPTTERFPLTGAVRYATALLPGVYDVALAAEPLLCTESPANPLLPCVGGVFRKTVHLDADGTFDLDVPALTITGTVSLAGTVMPESSWERGALEFTRAASEGGGSVRLSLGQSGEAAYSVTLVPGTYSTSHAVTQNHCFDPLPAIPCAAQELLVCE